LAKDIVCTPIASSQPLRSNKGIVRLLGVDRWTSRKAWRGDYSWTRRMMHFGWITNVRGAQMACFKQWLRLWKIGRKMKPPSPHKWRILLDGELQQNYMICTPHTIYKCQRLVLIRDSKAWIVVTTFNFGLACVFY
jgi:hypothetical protein